ncbi:MAG: alpha/beta hydrolase family esterase, partial [Pirellula sp.]
MMHLLATIAILLAADGNHLSPGDTSRTLKVDGDERSYLVHVPPQYVRDTPTPVVLAFHGGGPNARNMIAFSGLNQKADQAGFIVVYPDGSGRLERMLTFNAGNCCGQAATRNVDDVAFVRSILDDLEGIASVDHSISAWVEANGCNKSPRVTQLPDREKDGTNVKQVRYESGKDGAEVVLVIIQGGGHTWPGNEPRIKSLGVSTQDISANDMMW